MNRREQWAESSEGASFAVAVRMLGAIVLALPVVGCTVFPTAGLAPVPQAPAGWTSTDLGSAAPSEGEAVVADPSGQWWLAVDDPRLHRLVEQAGEIASVRIARDRLEEATAALRAANAELAPLVSGTAGASWSSPGDDAIRQSIRGASVGLSHDFDLSRANRSRQIAALASAQASAEAVDAARIEARALAARLYAAHVGAAERRAVAVATVRAFEDALALARARTRAGLGSELDVAQAQTALARARAAVPRLEAARDGARFGLESLLGLEPGALAEALAGAVSTPTVDPTPVLRTPVEVLASRPDLRVAERELVAAGATTAAAVRDRWPRLSLEAALGVQSVRVPWPLAADGLVQSLLLGVTAPLFDFGRLEARADAARARERAAAVAYRQAVFNALGEVETGINQFSRALAEGRLNDDAVDAASRQVALARARWRSGLVPFLDVVLAEQALYFAQAERALSRTRTLDAFTALSAAMGLGR